MVVAVTRCVRFTTVFVVFAVVSAVGTVFSAVGRVAKTVVLVAVVVVVVAVAVVVVVAPVVLLSVVAVVVAVVVVVTAVSVGSSSGGDNGSVKKQNPVVTHNTSAITLTHTAGRLYRNTDRTRSFTPTSPNANGHAAMIRRFTLHASSACE